MRLSKILQTGALSAVCALSALPVHAQLMQATVTGTVSYGSDVYSNSVLLGPNDGTSLVGLAASATIIYDSAHFYPNAYGANYWNFTHSPGYWGGFQGIVGQGPIISASFTVNGVTLVSDTSGTYENGKLAVENPVSNLDGWNLSGGDSRSTWCPNDRQCIETVQLSAGQGYGNDLFGGQAFNPDLAFTASPAAGRTIDAYVRLMQGPTCPAGMCPEGRFADTATHWVEFGIAGTQLTVTPVPEPATYAMLLAGLGLVGFAARRRAASSF